ncbi:MAG: hypothetical protein VKK59_06660 [Vampirovibrionales bacterium]|nr:hypothetical protein [Vampirovibrionales bacterium]
MTGQAALTGYHQAHAPTFWERYQTVLQRWGSRELVSGLGSQIAHEAGLGSEPCQLIKSASIINPQTAAKIQTSGLSYADLFNIAHQGVAPKAWVDADIRAAVRAANWQHAFQPNSATRGLPVWEYIRQHPKAFITGRIQSNLAPTTTALASGQHVLLGAMNALGLGMLGYTILENTVKGYHYAKSQQKDDSLKSKAQTALTTAGTFIGQSFKNILCWEIGSAGFAMARGALGLKGLPGTLTSVALGGIGSSLAYVGLSRVIANPPEKS